MRYAAFLLSVLALGSPLAAREAVDASAPKDLSVTLYRDPNRGIGEEMERSWPQGFAMISETRTVTLPPGESTVRFEGVAEGMVGVTAIVSGLPGGTIEKNRNTELLSPAALVNGTLGNRVTITRTNLATGRAASESAIVRTRADGGLVLETQAGFEAVRCAGLPEKLAFDRVPAGLSAKPVFSIDTRDETGGTYQVVLTYLAWGFDWQANYVGTLGPGKGGSNGDGAFTMRLLSWLTLLNDNGQSFPDAELLVVAGKLNVTSDFRGLAEPPRAEPLRLTCYPIGSTAAGSPVPYYGDMVPPPPPPPAPSMAYSEDSIVVTGARRENLASAAPVSVVTAEEEQLGDLKLYRVPMPVTVAAKGMKQVAFLNKDEVEARYVYRAECNPYDQFDLIEDESDMETTQMLLVTRNDKDRGLGVALPQGGLVLFEPGPFGPQLVAELDLRDYAVGQDVELEMGESAQVFSECANIGRGDPEDNGRRWTKMRAQLSNANSHPVTVRMVFGWAGDWEVRWPRRETRVKDGEMILELLVPANSTRSYDWRIRAPK